MLTYKAFKFRLNTNKYIEEKFYQFSGCCRFVWNKALAMEKESLTCHKKLVGWMQKGYYLKYWKVETNTKFLVLTPHQALLVTLKTLHKNIVESFNSKKDFRNLKIN